MKPTLVIPDIHEKATKVRRILAEFRSSVEQIVFMGDMWDSWNGRSTDSVPLYNDLLDDPTVTILLGNHDAHYLLSPWHSCVACSGFSNNFREEVVRGIHRRQFVRTFDLLKTGRIKIAAQVYGYLLTHAGVNQKWAPYFALPTLSAGLWAEELNTALASLLSTEDTGDMSRRIAGHPLFWVNGDRGGRDAESGPLWNDWRSHVPIPGLKQVFGHTQDATVRSIPENVCLDTNLQHVALIAPDSTLTVMDVRQI